MGEGTWGNPEAAQWEGGEGIVQGLGRKGYPPRGEIQFIYGNSPEGISVAIWAVGFGVKIGAQNQLAKGMQYLRLIRRQAAK